MDGSTADRIGQGGEDIPDAFRSSAYDYDLPEDHVAQVPGAERGDARLLVVDRGPDTEDPLSDRVVADLPSFLGNGDLLILNDTRVRPARIRGVRRGTGGKVEALVLEVRPGGLRLMLGSRGRLREGEVLDLAGGALPVRLASGEGGGVWRAETELDPPAVEAVLEAIGRVPLPPYIRRTEEGDPRDALDRERYQTVFARIPGAAAAPTAGLHLTPALLDSVRARGVDIATVTLHVGAGTLRPVSAPDLRDHLMHEEEYDVPEAASEAVAACRGRGGRVIPVGTTSLRVLESAALDERTLRPGPGRTNLFIHEPWRFRLADALFTNFHAPRSTLLMLVAAFAGRERILAAYRHAVARGYRFLSYGDAMFIG